VTFRGSSRVTVPLVTRLGARGALTGSLLRSTPRSAAIRRAAEADLPGSLADLDFAELGRGQLGDERRQQVVDEAVDGRVIVEAYGRRPRLGGAFGTHYGGPRRVRLPRSSTGSALVGHALDLLAGRWLLAAAPLRERHTNRPSPWVEQIPEAIGETGPLRLGDRGRRDLSVGAH
jgi:hypothetical protein